jgi:glucose dehydrogenase
MKRLLLMSLIGGSLLFGMRGDAQEEPRTPDPRATRPFVPVTDEMLMKPSPSDWLMWRRTQDGSGYSPLSQINRNNVQQPAHDVDARHGCVRRDTGRHADRLQRRHVSPRSGDAFEAIDARTGDVLWQYRHALPGKRTQQDQSNDGDLGHHDHRREHRPPDVRDRRAHGTAGVGDAHSRCDEARAGQRRTTHREWKGDRRPPVST